MPFTYTVYCYTPGCQNLAVCKVAARWSDGVTQELKTYALSCPDCLAAWFQRSREKQAACRLAQGETLDPPAIFLLGRGERDVQLQRQPELEQKLQGE